MQTIKCDCFRSRMEGGYCRSTFENGAYDMGSRDHEHRDHSVLDDLVRRLSAVIEHKQAYHEEREVYAYKPGSAAGSVGIFENGDRCVTRTEDGTADHRESLRR